MYLSCNIIKIKFHSPFFIQLIAYGTPFCNYFLLARQTILNDWTFKKKKHSHPLFFLNIFHTKPVIVRNYMPNTDAKPISIQCSYFTFFFSKNSFALHFSFVKLIIEWKKHFCLIIIFFNSIYLWFLYLVHLKAFYRQNRNAIDHNINRP